MWPTVPAVGSRQTESTLSHVVATEDLRSSRPLFRPSRGFSGASDLLSPHGCRRGPHFSARPCGLRNPIEPTLAPMLPWWRGWTAAGVFFSRGGPGEGVPANRFPSVHLPTLKMTPLLSGRKGRGWWVVPAHQPPLTPPYQGGESFSSFSGCPSADGHERLFFKSLGHLRS